VSGQGAPAAGLSTLPRPASPAAASPKDGEFRQLVDSLAQLSEDGSVPRNVRRGAQSAKVELEKPRVALDVRIASAVYILDDLANDPNLPTHGRTAIWSIISRLESFQ
jgi:uncharacterized protein (UPF0147 family)